MSGIKFTLAALKNLGATPNKKLGQNFLIDLNIVKKSIELAKIRPNDNVVEVGPGLGALTAELLNTGAKVFAVEYDRALYSFLNAKFSNNESFSLIHGNALEFPVAGLEENAVSYKIVSNLPYAISTPWIDCILERRILPDAMVLMLQLETVRRFTSPHGCKNFGAISIFLGSAYLVKNMHEVSKKCFYPEPKVASALLVLQKKEHPYYFHQKTKVLIRYLFNHRRKQIGSILKSFYTNNKQFADKILQTLEIDSKARPESISIAVWQNMDQEIKSLKF
jgi:16S rRNA (adenine1518-N6/adenine1519-N6)-dimethyltransferase